MCKKGSKLYEKRREWEKDRERERKGERMKERDNEREREWKREREYERERVKGRGIERASRETQNGDTKILHKRLLLQEKVT